MKLRKKLMVWGAFLVMGMIIVGCAEEETQFDSKVDVTETESQESSIVGNVHSAKDSVGDALLGMLMGDDDEEVTSEEISEENSLESNELDTASVDSFGEDSTHTEEVVSDNYTSSRSPSIGDVGSASSVKEEPEIKEPIAQTSQEVEEEELSTDSDITVIIINETGVGFGMIAIIDPLSHEQTLIGALDSDGMIIFEMTWPSKEKYFRIGVYDESGNLLKEEAIEFKGITKGSVVTLKGSGNLSEIVGQVE